VAGGDPNWFKLNFGRLRMEGRILFARFDPRPRWQPKKVAD
jgi:hypothetical protein